MSEKKSCKLTQEELKKVLHYDPKTGEFMWRERNIEYFRDFKDPIRIHNAWNSKYSGKITGTKKDGYIIISYKKKGYKKELYRAHRLAFLYMEGYYPENKIDHINRIRDDNRWCNLREVSDRCSLINRGLCYNNTSGVAGVKWDERDKLWRSYVSINSKYKHVGCFKDFNMAVKARWLAEKKYKYLNCISNSSAYIYLVENNLINGEE